MYIYMYMIRSHFGSSLTVSHVCLLTDVRAAGLVPCAHTSAWLRLRPDQALLWIAGSNLNPPQTVLCVICYVVFIGHHWIWKRVRNNKTLGKNEQRWLRKTAESI